MLVPLTYPYPWGGYKGTRKIKINLWLYLSLESPGFNDEEEDPEKGQMHLIFILQALPTQYMPYP
jgi:hypothetical protein